jgi:hypothetical protein
VVFNSGSARRELLIPQSNTPANNALRTSLLYGNAMATTDGKELRISTPAQSVSIFSLE